MMEGRESLSSCRTIITPNIPKDRVITKFPQAYHPDATPYQKMNFDPRVKDACSANKTGTVGLKICKAVLVGDVAVGKSCLVNRFCKNVFDRDYRATIGVDFEVEKFSILAVPFNLQVWDTAGQERFKCIAASYYRGANVVIIVFDLSEIESLANTKTWKIDACKNADNPLVFLIGTKKDLVSEAAFKEIEKEAVAVAQDLGAEFWALSSKTGERVQEFFFRAVSMTFDRAVLRELENLNSPMKQQIGNNLTFKVDRNRDNVYEKNQTKLKCCA